MDWVNADEWVYIKIPIPTISASKIAYSIRFWPFFLYLHPNEFIENHPISCESIYHHLSIFIIYKSNISVNDSLCRRDIRRIRRSDPRWTKILRMTYYIKYFPYSPSNPPFYKRHNKTTSLGKPFYYVVQLNWKGNFSNLRSHV